MRILILALATGIWIVQLLPALPAQESVGAATLAGTVVLLLAAVLRARAGGPRAALLALAGLCLGLAWAGLRAQERLADALPEGNEGRDLRIVGVIAGLPQEFERGLRFEFEVEAAEARVPERL